MACGITAVTRTADRTGVEMEALTAVATSGLALIDMIKAIDPAAVITDIRVEEKTGGKTGVWRRPARPGRLRETARTAARQLAAPRRAARQQARGRHDQGAGHHGVQPGGSRGVRRQVRAGAGRGCCATRAARWRGRWSSRTAAPSRSALQDAVEAGYDVVVTTGGTGLTPTDATPEMTRLLIDREVPGIAEAIRAAGVACRGPGRGAVPRRSRGGRDHADRQPARLGRRRPRWHDRAVGPAAARRGPDQGRRPSAPGGGLMRSAAARRQCPGPLRCQSSCVRRAGSYWCAGTAAIRPALAMARPSASESIRSVS